MLSQRPYCFPERRLLLTISCFNEGDSSTTGRPITRCGVDWVEWSSIGRRWAGPPVRRGVDLRDAPLADATWLDDPREPRDDATWLDDPREPRDNAATDLPDDVCICPDLPAELLLPGGGCTSIPMMLSSLPGVSLPRLRRLLPWAE